MNNKALMALLLVSGAVATPAYANYFHNPYLGINLNIGSAPNPTPADLRAERLPIIVQDDSTPAAAAPADAAKLVQSPSTPIAQNQTHPASGSVVAAESR